METTTEYRCPDCGDRIVSFEYGVVRCGSGHFTHLPSFTEETDDE